MDEFITKQEAQDRLYIFAMAIGQEEKLGQALRDIIRDIPSEDVRRVTLCKHCYAYGKDKELAEAKHLNLDEYCALNFTEMPKYGYCFYGRREEDIRKED